MGTTANIFTLKLDNRDFQSQLKQAAKYSEQYNNQIANSILETARLEQKRVSILQEKAKAQAEGNKAQVRALNQELLSVSALISAENKKIAAIKQTNSYLDQNVKSINRQILAEKQAASAIDQTTQAIKNGESVRDSQFNHLIRMLRWGGTLVATYYAISQAWNLTIGRGIEVNRVIEDNTNGIAALIAANTMLTTTTGKTVTAQERFTTSLGISADTMLKLRKAAPETAGTFEDMVTIFQQGFAQTISMGNSFGSTVGEITNNTIKLTQRMMNIAGAMGMPMDRVREEIRSLLSANASTDSLLATMLFGSPSEANNAVKRAKELGAGALEGMLTKKLEVFDVLAQVDTYTKQLSRAKDAYDTIVAEISKPVFSDLKELFSTFADKANVQNIEQLRKEIADLYETGKNVAEVVAKIGVAFISWKILSRLVTEISLVSSAIGTLTTVTAGASAATLTLTERVNMAKGAFKALSMSFAPTAALMIGYELYMSLVGEDIARQEKLHNIMGMRIADLKNLTSAQLMSNRAILDQEIRQKSFEVQQAKVKVAGAPTDVTVRARKDELQAELENLLRMRNEINNAQLAQKEANKTFAEMQKGGKGVGGLQVSQLDKKWLGDAQEYTEKKLPEAVKITNDLAAAEKQLKIARKEGDTAAQKTIQEFIAQKKKELSELNDKANKKAKTEANQVAKEERSAFELLTLRFETERAERVALEASKKANFELDVERMTELEKLDLSQFDRKETALRKELLAAEQLKDSQNGENAVLETKKKIYEVITNRSEFMLRVNDRIAQAIERQNAAADKVIGKQYERTLSLMEKQTGEVGVQTSTERIFGKGKITREEADRLIQEARNAFPTWELITPEAQQKEMDKLDDFIANIKAKVIEIPDIEIDVKLKGWDDFSSAIANGVNSFSDLATATEKYGALRQEYIREGRNTAKLDTQYQQSVISGFSDMTSAAVGFYSEDDQRRKKQMQVAQAMQMAQMAMQVANLAQSSAFTAMFVAQEEIKATAAGATAVAVAAQSSPWTGFATAAAMIALLASIGIALQGKGSTTTTYDQYSAMKANEGVGSALGSDKASASMSKSLELLADYKKPEFIHLASMDQSLQSIDDKIGGLSSLLIRQGGFAFGAGATEFSNSKQNVSLSSAGFSLLAPVFDITDKLLAKIPVLSSLSGFASGLVNSILGGVFGKTSVNQSLSDYGILFNDQLVTSAIDAIQGNAYQTIRTEVKKKSWFSSSTSVYFNTYFAAMDQEIKNQFSLVLGNVYDTIVSTGKMMDTAESSLIDSLSTFVVKLGKISFKGKTGDQIQEDLSNIFSQIADEMVQQAYKSQLAGFQQIGEGLFQTLTRVASGMEIAGSFIDKLGRRFTDPKFTEIVNQQGDVGLEALRLSILRFEEATYGATSGVYDMVSVLGDSADELYQIYTAFGNIRIQLSAIGKATSSLTSDMIVGAGSIDDLQSGMTSFIENFMTKGEQLAYKTSVMAAEFDKLGLALPSSADAFKRLIQSVDTSTASGQELYGRLIILSSGFNDLNSAMEDSTSTIRNILASLTKTVESTSDSLKKTIEELLRTTSGGDDPLTQYKRQFNALTTEIRGFTDASGNLLPQFEGDFSQKVSDLESISKNILGIQSLSDAEKSTLTANLVNELQGVKSIADITKETLSVYVENDSLKVEGTTSLVQYIEGQGLKPLNSFAVGSRYIPYDQTANIHQGEMIIDRSGAEALRRYGVEVGGVNNIDYTPLFKELSDRLGVIEKNSKVTADSTEQMAFVGVTLAGG